MTTTAPPAVPSLARLRLPDHRTVVVDGVDVVVAERPVLPLVQVVAVRRGPVAHTARRLAAATLLDCPGVRDRLASIGASASAEATPDGVLLRLRAPAGDAARVIATAIDLLRPQPPDASLVTAALQRLAGEDEAAAADPALAARRAAIERRFGADHALAEPPLSAAGAATADDVAAWWVAHAGIVLSAAGAIRCGDVAGADTRLTPAPLAVPPAVGWELRERSRSAQACLRAIAVLPPLGHPDRAAATLADRILGGYHQSRLRAALREQRGWGYHPGTTVADHAGVTLLTLEVDVATEVARPAAAVVGAELRRLAGEPVGAEELVNAQRGVAVDVMRRLDAQGDLADLALQLALNGADLGSLDDHVGAVAAADAEAVRAAAAAFVADLSGVVVADPSVFAGRLEPTFPYDDFSVPA